MKGYYYKNKYLIALYDKDDFIYVVADNVYDLLKLLYLPIDTKTINQMTSKIGHALARKNKKIYINGKALFIHLIPVNEEDL